MEMFFRRKPVDLLKGRRLLLLLFGVIISVQCLLSPFFSKRQFDADVGRTLSLNGDEQWEPKTSATLCEVKKNIPKEWFKSQSAEDEQLMKWFSNLCGGTYLEMGALDGYIFSNSFVFNKGLGWRGVLIEASPTKYQRLVHNRPSEIATIHAGVCGERRDLHYVEGVRGPATGGFVEFAAPDFQNRYWTADAIANATLIKCLPLQNILDEHVVSDETMAQKGGTYFDFYSLDVEGAEYDALSSLDFKRVQFGIILVESDAFNERKNMAVRTLLEANGYTFLMDLGRSYWFVNMQFSRIYKNVLHSQ